MFELSVDLSREFDARIERASRKIGAAFQSPTADPRFNSMVQGLIEEHADRLVKGLQQIHSKSITPYTGASFESIRKIKARGFSEEYSEAKIVPQTVAVGYFPKADHSRDTPYARKVQAYFGGVVGNESIQGALLKGLKPYEIRAPVPGIGGKGTFGGEGWTRLAAYLRSKAKRFGTATVRVKTKSYGKQEYRYRDGMQDVWAVVRRMETRGLFRTPIPDDFYALVVPAESGRFRAKASNAIRKWWEASRS